MHKPQNNLEIPIFNASPLASYMHFSSENNGNKRSGIPPSHPNNAAASLPCSSQIIGYGLNSQQGSPSHNHHSRSLSQPAFFSVNIMPSCSTPPSSVSTLSDPVYNDVSMEKMVLNSNPRSPLPAPVTRGHKLSSSDFPLGFSHSAMIQSSPQSNLIGNSSVEEPIQSVKRELTDDLFNAYMNLEILETLNSSGTEDKDLDSRGNSGTGTKTCGGESSDNEVESSVNGHPVTLHCHGMSSGVSIVKKEGVKRSAGEDIAPIVRYYRSVSMDSYKGGLQFEDESAKRNPGVHQSPGIEFNEAELKKIMENKKLAEIAYVDPKRAKRILANRQSAARSKERKVRYIAELEHKVQTLKIEATTLSAQLTRFQRDSFGLTDQNNELKLRLQAMEQQAQLKDALNEALAAEVERLKLAAAELSGEAHLSNAMAQQLSINHSRFESQSHSRQLNFHQIQQHQTQHHQLQNQQQNSEPTGNESN